MIINIYKIQSVLKIFKRKIEKYELTIFNYYNELNIISSNWRDGYSISFFECIDENKKGVLSFINSLKEFLNIYEFLLDEYGKFGKKTIEFHLDNFNDLSKQKDILNNEINYLLNELSNVDSMNYSANLVNAFSNQKRILFSQKERIKNIFINFSNFYSSINSLENEIYNMIDAITFSNIKENSYNFSLKNVDSVMMNVDAIEISLKKIKMYYNDLAFVSDDLKNSINELIMYYRTDNFDSLMEVHNTFSDTFDKIIDFFNHNIVYLEERKNSYVDNVNTIKNVFEKLG